MQDQSPDPSVHLRCARPYGECCRAGPLFPFVFPEGVVMEEVSSSRAESARKIGARIQSEILQRLAEVTQERAAECMGVPAITISRPKEDAGDVDDLSAGLGLQLAA